MTFSPMSLSHWSVFYLSLCPSLPLTLFSFLMMTVLIMMSFIILFMGFHCACHMKDVISRPWTLPTAAETQWRARSRYNKQTVWKAARERGREMTFNSRLKGYPTLVISAFCTKAEKKINRIVKVCNKSDK